MSAIELKNLTKKYGSLTAVNNLNLEIEKGEIFGFLGPNGAGKTTTIKLLSGLLKPTSGTAKILGFDIQVNPIEAKSYIGLIPDEPNIYEKLTGREFLRFMGNIFKVENIVIVKKTDELLKIFDLQDRADELIQVYSHGMKQKIAIAGALIHSPKIIIFDEPTIGLDPKSARTIKDILKYRAESGDCIFMSTHILEIAERMCDRIGIINNGNLIAVGNMDELRHLSKSGKYNLEEIFLELTNAEENSELIKSLS
ncbi:MAG: ABC transporter ATP-binding protein [Actinobacteria bacterium]|nr:ABC transporter ATP-binding protein [Actinomycetota bacterium]